MGRRAGDAAGVAPIARGRASPGAAAQFRARGARSQGAARFGRRRRDHARRVGPRPRHEPRRRGLVRLRRQGSGGRKLPHPVRAAEPERSGGALRACRGARSRRRAAATNFPAATGAARRSRSRLTLARVASAGAPARYCAAVRDLGPSKAAERALETARDAAEQANARKTEFLARVSHEVRTPLHAILGFAEVMMEERFGPIGNDRYRDYVKRHPRFGAARHEPRQRPARSRQDRGGQAGARVRAGRRQPRHARMRLADAAAGRAGAHHHAPVAVRPPAAR